MLLGSLDVAVHLMLRLESLVTTEYIIHYIQPKNDLSSLQRQTSRRGRGMDARQCGP